MKKQIESFGMISFQKPNGIVYQTFKKIVLEDEELEKLNSKATGLLEKWNVKIYGNEIVFYHSILEKNEVDINKIKLKTEPILDQYLNEAELMLKSYLA